MKKTIIIVSSIVLLLGVNFASAMKVLPPLAIAEPLNAFEQQIWNDIQILQNQISNLAQRLIVVERKTQPVSLVDANGVVRGPIFEIWTNGYVEFWDTAYNRKFYIDSIYDEDNASDFEKFDGYIGNQLYFDQINCQGNAYYKGSMFPTEIWKLSDNGTHPNGWEYVKTESLDTYSNHIILSSKDSSGCYSVNPNPSHDYKLVVEATPVVFHGPLTIQD